MSDTMHFAGDVTPVDGRQLFGPDRDSAVYVATTAHYDPNTDRTIVSLRPLSGDERRERIKAIVADEQRVLRIRRLFLGEVR